MFGQAIEVIFVDFGNVAKIPDWHDTYVCPQHLIDKESNCIHFFDEDFEEFEEHDVEEYLAQGYDWNFLQGKVRSWFSLY